MGRVQHSKHTIHPCIALQKESEPRSSLETSEGKTRLLKKTTIVRSRYFQNKNMEENDIEVTAANKNPTSEGEPMSVLRSTEFNRVENRKLITSHYFMNKIQENTNERHIETNENEGLPMKRKFSIVDDNVQKVSNIFFHMAFLWVCVWKI